MILDYSWPLTGDAPFLPVKNGGATGLDVRRDLWHDYAESYLRAADLLAQHALALGRDHVTLIYPLGFLYRHALEVMLKLLLHQDGREPHRSHDLLTLWQECRGVIERLCYAIEPAALDATAAILQQFAEKDREATAFRYPVHRDGRLSFPVQASIDLKNLAIIAGRAYAMLSDLNCAITAHLKEERGNAATALNH
jgi:hypothetical protein